MEVMAKSGMPLRLGHRGAYCFGCGRNEYPNACRSIGNTR